MPFALGFNDHFTCIVPTAVALPRLLDHVGIRYAHLTPVTVTNMLPLAPGHLLLAHLGIEDFLVLCLN